MCRSRVRHECRQYLHRRLCRFDEQQWQCIHSNTRHNTIVVDRSNKVGYNLDTLCVVTVDTTTGITDTTVVIISNTPTRDTIRDTNVIYTTDTICASIDNGMSNIVTTIVDCAGAMNNSGNVYTALADGCIAITRSGVVGYNLDTLCIVKTDTVTGISDTTVAIISNLPKRDTIRDTNVIITTDTVCVDVELGMNADSIYIVDCAGSMNNSGNVYTVIPGTTCIVVDRSNKVGYNLDTLCVVTVDTTTGITDTTVVIISNTPTRDTIRDTNVIYTTDTICASIDNGMSNIRTTIVDCAGAMNNSGNVYTALTDGCIAITRSGVVGYNLDTLCIVKTDTVTGISDTTVAIISNLPKRDTIRDTNVIITTDTVCVEVELGMDADSIYIVDCAGAMNNSGNVYTVIPGTTCIVVDRSDKVGYNLDTLCVVTVDTTTGITDTTVVIISNTPTRDTIRDTNIIYTTDTICASIDNGMSNIVTTIVDCAGAMNNSGNVYTALADGCIAITRSGVVGYNLDTLCIVKTDTVTGISDTTVAIISNLPKRDTIRDTNVIITTDTVCVDVELGMNADSIYIVDCAGAMNNSGNVYTVIPGTTCIVVDRSNKVGYNLDTLCVVTVDTTTGITDTTVVIISNTPTRDTIRDTNVIYTTDTICASIDNGMSNIVTTIVDCAGAMNNSGNVYTALADGCIAITRSGVVGYNLDTLCIVKTDTVTGISDTTVAIISNLPKRDTIRDTNVIITTDTVCVDVELGMNADSIYIVDCAGSMNNSGNVYTVIPGTACIVVDRSNKVGYNLDTLCVVTVDTTTGITDTTVVIISNTPTRDTIRDTNVIYTTDTICASIDNGMSNIVTTIVDCAGAMNNSGNVYTALADGCIAITRSGVVGYNLDTLCIVKTDTVTGISDTTVAIISNLPKRDTIRDTNVIITTDTVCVDVELGMNADSIYIVDCAGAMNNSGNVYTVIPGTTCIVVDRSNKVGYNLDTLCVVTVDTTTGITDTTVVIISNTPTRDTIRDTNVIYTTDTICASIDNGMSNIVTTIVDCAGAMNNSGNVYTALADGCIAITRSGVVGYNLDTLCIVKTDTVTGISDTTVAIISNLPKRDTIRDTNVIITTDTVCVDVELGMNADSIYIVDCAGSMNNSGNVYTVIPGTTCIVVDRSDKVGYNLDTLCVVTVDTTTGITDTTVVIISNTPTRDTIRDTNVIYTTDTICASIDNGMSNIVTTIVDCAGAMNNSGNVYTALADGCIAITRSGVVGYNLDTLCIVKTDTVTGISDTTVAIISNLPKRDTIRDTNVIITTDTVCVEVELGMNADSIYIVDCAGSMNNSGNVYTVIPGTNMYRSR
ncbi:MAG: hypothetical protein IPK18_11300 [Sphingobacteriales bacterium]|nr:MAG: hypothetical protein IPK18_11300 [Sphingobacteriales bacterium]